MTEDDFVTYMGFAVSNYANEKVASDSWPAEEAHARAAAAFSELLPQGLATEDQHLLTIVDNPAGNKAGFVWFGVTDLGKGPVAFIYDFVIFEELRRRGFGSQALRALEDKVRAMNLNIIGLHVFGHNQAARALYDSVGYTVSDVTMTKML
jgi:ribosomal protein S18 acetylase RimI-like enzyme